MKELLQARPGSATDAHATALSGIGERSPWTARLLRLAGESVAFELVPIVAWLFAAEELPLRAPDFEGKLAANELEAVLDPARAGATPLGRALATCAPEVHAALAAHLTALREVAEVRAVASFEELGAQASKRSAAAADALLAGLVRAARIEPSKRPRLEVRMRATAAAVVRVHWLAAAGHDWRLAGTLRLPIDVLRRAGVELSALAKPEEARGLDEVMREAALRAADELGKAWPLTRDLGPWRGRLVAVLLRRATFLLLGLYKRPLEPWGPSTVRLGRWSALRAAAGLITRRPPRALAAAVARYSSR